LFELLLLLLGFKSSSPNKHIKMKKRWPKAVEENELAKPTSSEAGREVLLPASRASRMRNEDIILSSYSFL
jgi:hypothetical protein